MDDAVCKRFNHNSPTVISGTNLNTLARLLITSDALTMELLGLDGDAFLIEWETVGIYLVVSRYSWHISLKIF